MSMPTGLSHGRGRVGLLAALVVALGVGTRIGAEEDVPDKVALTGRVVNEAGAPVAGAGVKALTRPSSEPVTSDAGGVFRLSVPSSPQGWIHAMILARGGDGRLGVLLVHCEEKQTVTVTVVLKPARTLEVRVIDAGGHAVEGAEVHWLTNLQEIAAGRTDALGQWTEQVPADAKAWGVYALKPKVGFDYAVAERARGSTLPLLPLPERLTLTLDGARPPVRVKTVDRENRPLAGLEVGPWLIKKPGHESEMNGINTFVKTDGNGVATLDWLPTRAEGMFSIISPFSSSWYPSEHATWFPSDKPADEVTIIHFPYEQLSGRVTTADGRPAAEAVLTVQGQGAGENEFRGRTRTGADGRYTLGVYSEQAYIITASKAEMIAPYKSGVVVRAGKPAGNIDLVLGPATRVRGLVTVGPDHKPVAGVSVQATIDRGSIPDELKRKGDRFYRGMTMTFWKQTGKDGRFEVLLGPGEYTLQGPPRVEPVKLTIPAARPPAEIVRDFAMPRPESGPFTAAVVDTAGKPVAGAIVEGAYQAASGSGWFNRIEADAQGTIRIKRKLDPLVLAAATPDRSLGAVTRIDAEATEARLVIRPTATASGRLVDPQGKTIDGRKLSYGIRIHLGPTRMSPFSWHFGGTTTTDSAGAFRLVGLVVGETYEITTRDDEDYRTSTAKTRVTPTDPSPIALGDVPIELRVSPPKPYVPPTPAQRAGESFAVRKEKSPREKLDYVLTEAKREYTRPLLLFGGPKDPACVDLFRLFDERSGDETAAKDKPRVKSPGDLRWEFELATLDAGQTGVKTLAKGLGVPLGDAEPPRLAVLSDQGRLIATYPLRLGNGKQLDARALGAFLLENKLPTRDAEAMLEAGLAQARAERKRVFLILSASWCGPCRLLARFLTANKAELGRHYVFVKLDVSRDAHASVLRERYESKDDINGVPWYVILDAAGKPLITSNAKELGEEYGTTNVGFPSSKEGINHFLKMIRQTAPELSDRTLAVLRQELEKKP